MREADTETHRHTQTHTETDTETHTDPYTHAHMHTLDYRTNIAAASASSCAAWQDAFHRDTRQNMGAEHILGEGGAAVGRDG